MNRYWKKIAFISVAGLAAISILAFVSLMIFSSLYFGGTDWRLVYISGLVLLGCLVAQIVLVLIMLVRLDRVFVDKNNRLRRIVSSSSHELKTPLTLIMANVELLEAENGPNELIDDILEEGRHMARVVDKSVKLSKLEEGEWTLTLSTVDMGHLVERGFENFAPLAMRQGLKVEKNIEHGVYAEADEGEMKEVLFILLENAVKYCDPEGCVDVRLFAEDAEAIIVVENDFAGADQAEIPLYFDRFYRGEAVKDQTQGDGLGLTLALMSVKKHGGSMRGYARDGRIGFVVSLERVA